MENSSGRLREIVKGAVDTAHGRIHEIEEGALKVVRSVHDRFRTSQEEGAKRFEELVGNWKVKELLERLHADEVLAYGVSLRREMSERLGFVLESDFAQLVSQVETLRGEVTALRSKITSAGKEGAATLQKQMKDLKAELGRLKKTAEKPEAKA